MGEEKHGREEVVASAKALPVNSHTKQSHQYPNPIQQIGIVVFRSCLFFSVGQLS